MSPTLATRPPPIVWLPNHAGITGNERVDSLAHSATILGCHCFMKVSTYDYLNSFCFFLFSHWQSFWSDLSNNKPCAVKPSVFSWSDPYHKNRWWETALTQLRIGHTNLTHSYNMTHSPPTLYITCNTTFLYSTFCCSALVTLLPKLQFSLTRLIYFDLPALMIFLQKYHIFT